MAAVSQLSQRLANQKEEIDQLREEQQKMFRGIQQKLDAMTGAIVGSQRTAIAEQAKEQRILDNNVRGFRLSINSAGIVQNTKDGMTLK